MNVAEPSLKIAVLKELAPGESRVAASPETIKKFASLGAKLFVENEAGQRASFTDDAFVSAGASVANRTQVLHQADIVLCVQAPPPESLKGMKEGAWLVGALDPLAHRGNIDEYAKLGIEALAMEFMPRITRAQSMDILSSQSNLAGYASVIEAASAFGRAIPMMMTAAGTITAARIFVMGVGVAGLQAIATGRRLGAQVSATDVRSATKEQIESLGAKAIFVPDVAGIEGEGSGGYATEMSDEYKTAQSALVSSHIAKQDIVITTALIPGRPAPRLVSDAQIASMRPGSVIVDLAAEKGGNVEGAAPGETIERHGVKILAPLNLASQLAADSSALFARNLFNFLAAFWDKQQGRPILPDGDEIAASIRLTQGGLVTHPRLMPQMETSAA